MTPPQEKPNGFYGLGLAPKLLEAVESIRLQAPTPIQAQAIPIAVQGQDIMGIAQTGTGKTFAFGLPMIQRLAQVKGRGLVILPTRELAIQVDESLQRVGKKLGLRTAILIGGVDMKRQLRQLNGKPHVIIGTPGRINDHLEQRTLDVSDIKILVLDEADRMLDMGFAPQINRIVKSVPKDRQTMLFSATMPQEITRLATTYMHLPVRVEIARQGSAADKVTQELFVLQKIQKLAMLQKLLEQYHGSVLVFSRTKFGAKKICKAVKTMGHAAAEIHSNRSLNQRKDALEGFKKGKYRVLVATDIAARGIHVSGIELVINFDLPEQAEDYVHRIGRTGRAGREGHAISFATPDQGRLVREIERLVRVHLPVSKVPHDMPTVKMPSVEDDRDDRRGGYRGSRGGSRSGGRSRSGGYGQRRDSDREDDRGEERRSAYGQRRTSGYGGNPRSGRNDRFKRKAGFARNRRDFDRVDQDDDRAPRAERPNRNNSEERPRLRKRRVIF